MSSSLKEKLTAYREQVESALDDCLPPAGTAPSRLHAAMRYSAQASGKRIRPVLLIASAQLFPPRADPLPAAAAIECLHTYTLIHDDLPAIDNSDLRRGRPACHTRFDEATALLAGDGLLTLAFEILAENYADQPGLARALVADLAGAAGSRRLIGGQMEDVLNEDKAVSPELLQFIHDNKTGALLTAALTMGLRFGNPGERQLQAMRRAGHHLGMTFQIVDDILDATADADALGKPTGNDSAAQKTTYPVLYGLEKSRAEATRHTRSCIEALESLGGENDFLIELAASLEHRLN